MRNIFEDALEPATDSMFMSFDRKSKIGVAMDTAIIFGMLEALEGRTSGLNKEQLEKLYENKVHRLMLWTQGGNKDPGYLLP